MKLSVWLLTLGISTLAFTPKNASDPWPVPEKYQKMPNPVKPDAASVEIGKRLYGQHCQSCHGKNGKGDGPKADQLESGCGDFSGVDFQKQTDGSIYYKITEGRWEMPPFKNKITEAGDIWSVVNFLRTLKKAS